MEGPRTVALERRLLNVGTVGFVAQAAIHTVAAAAPAGSGWELAGMAPAMLGPVFLLGSFIGPIVEDMHAKTVAKLAVSGALFLAGGVATMLGTVGHEAQAMCACLATFAAAWCALHPTPRYTGYIRNGYPLYEDGSGPA